MFILHDGVLCRLWTEERDPLLVLAHNQNGHNEINPVHFKTQTLNIVEDTTCKRKSRKNRPKHDQHIES